MNKKGFTLIELLIVVAIIGILAAIAVPTLLSTRGAAVENKAKGTLRQVVAAQGAYFARNNAYGDFAALQAAGFLDTRFTTGGFVEDGVNYTDATLNGDSSEYTLTATLPANLGGQTYQVDESGRIIEL